MTPAPECLTMLDMERDASITFRLPSATRRALERAAEADRRGLSNLIAAILTDWLEHKGYLPKPKRERRGGS